MKYLITGGAGFIGFHTSMRLIGEGHDIVAIDNFNDHYDPKLKRHRQKTLLSEAKRLKRKVTYHEIDIQDFKKLSKVFLKEKPDRVVHLAARAGVRDSVTNPWIYVSSNVMGTLNIFESCKLAGIKSLVYASSSSVYGGNNKWPSSEEDRCDKPISLYAQTKRDNELMAHTYFKCFGISSIGLRFFTVYGPYGRPDMAAYIFADGIRNGKEITINNNGKMERDFTFVTDIVDGILRSSDRIAKENECEVINLGNHNPTDLMYYVGLIEKNLGMQAKKKFGPLPLGDVIKSCADVSKAKKLLGWQPKVKIEEGIEKFIKWYKEYNGIK